MSKRHSSEPPSTLQGKHTTYPRYCEWLAASTGAIPPRAFFRLMTNEEAFAAHEVMRSVRQRRETWTALQLSSVWFNVMQCMSYYCSFQIPDYHYGLPGRAFERALRGLEQKGFTHVREFKTDSHDVFEVKVSERLWRMYLKNERGA